MIMFFFFLFFFTLDFGLSRLTSLQFIQYHVAGFYKPTIPQSPPSHLRDYSTCNNARLEFSTIFVPSFDPNEWCLKNGLHSGCLNPGPLSLESSALTTRPRLLALRWLCLINSYFDFKNGQLSNIKLIKLNQESDYVRLILCLTNVMFNNEQKLYIQSNLS